MKKYICTFVVTAFISLNAFGQVEIDNANNVGIGISTPTQKLDVNGILRVRNIPLDNSLQQVLVQDPIGNVHFRDAATIGNWTKFGDSLYSDTLCLVGIGTTSPLQKLHVLGIARTQIGNALFDIWPIPGPPVGIGGGVDLIFNKDNVCVGKFIWEEKIFPPIPTLPDPVFKLFPRSSSSPSQAPGLEVATIGNTGLGLEGTRLMLCPSTVGPFPLWDNPRIDLKIANEIEINPGGPAGGLVISNIGSSGWDGVSVDIPKDELRFGTIDSATSRVAELRLLPISPVESFFDVTYDTSAYRIRLNAIDDGLRLGTGLELSELQLIEGHTDAGGISRLALFPDKSAGHDFLTISNIGSSGQDGVSIALWESQPIPVEIISLELVSSSPIPIVRHGANSLVTEHQYNSILREIKRTIADTLSITSFPHEYVYDGINNLIRETGPPLKTYESFQLKHTSLYQDLQRTTNETWEDLLAPGLSHTLEFDFAANQMRIVSSGQVMVLPGPLGMHIQGNLNVSGLLTKGGGTFKIDHPQDPLNKYLYHSFVESPDMMNIYNGNITTDEKGRATVSLPDYFSALNMDFRYQLTTIGQQALAWIAEELNGNTFTISTDKANVKVSWQITGIRQDTFANENRVQVEVDKEESMKGKLLYEPKKDLGFKY